MPSLSLRNAPRICDSSVLPGAGTVTGVTGEGVAFSCGVSCNEENRFNKEVESPASVQNDMYFSTILA